MIPINSRKKRAIAEDLRNLKLRQKSGVDVDSDEFTVLLEALELYVNALGGR